MKLILNKNKVLFDLFVLFIIFISLVTIRFYTHMPLYLFIILFVIYFGLFVSVGMYLKRIRIKDPRFYCGLLVFVLTMIFMMNTFNKTFPIAEGWYTVYAELIQNGKMPYSDFQYLYPPLYMFVVFLIVSIFGPKIIVLRVFGLFLFVLIAVVFYRIFLLILKPFLAAFCAFTALMVMQSEVVQVSYDYVILFNLFNYLGILLSLTFFKTNQQKYIVLAGICFSNVFLIRQPSGLVLIAYLVGLLVFKAIYEKKIKNLKSLLWALVGIAIPIVFIALVLTITNSIVPFFSSVFIDAANAKGGITAILFNWIPKVYNIREIIFCSEIIFLVFLLILNIHQITKIKQKNNYQMNIFEKVLFLIFGSLIIALVVIVFAKDDFAYFFQKMSVWNYANLSCIFITALFFISVILILIFTSFNKKVDIEYILICAFSGFLFATNYGCGMSGGLAEGQIALNYALILGLIAFFGAKLYLKYSSELIAIMSCILVSLSSLSRKTLSSYGWWGLCQGKYSQQTEPIEEIDKLEDIYVDQNTKEYLTKIVDIINSDKTAKTIYCFPQIPIFYSLTNCLPNVYSVVPWFDVASDLDVERDLSWLICNMPKYMVVAYCGEYTMSMHELMFREKGTTSAQRDVYGWIDELKEKKVYSVAYLADINKGVFSEYRLELLKFEDFENYELARSKGQALGYYYQNFSNGNTASLDDKISNVLSLRELEDQCSSYSQYFQKIKKYGLKNIIVSKNTNLEDYPFLSQLLSNYLDDQRDFEEDVVYMLDSCIWKASTSEEYENKIYEDGWLPKEYFRSFWSDSSCIELFLYYPPECGTTNLEITVNDKIYHTRLGKDYLSYRSLRIPVIQNDFNVLSIKSENDYTNFGDYRYNDFGVIMNMKDIEEEVLQFDKLTKLNKNDFDAILTTAENYNDFLDQIIHHDYEMVEVDSKYLSNEYVIQLVNSFYCKTIYYDSDKVSILLDKTYSGSLESPIFDTMLDQWTTPLFKGSILTEGKSTAVLKLYFPSNRGRATITVNVNGEKKVIEMGEGSSDYVELLFNVDDSKYADIQMETYYDILYSQEDVRDLGVVLVGFYVQ